MDRPDQVAAALRDIARAFEALADAVAGDPAPVREGERELAILREWGERGLSRAEASALFRSHGLAPQATGGWVRGDWIELRDDGLRYLTKRSHAWLAEQADPDA